MVAHVRRYLSVEKSVNNPHPSQRIRAISVNVHPFILALVVNHSSHYVDRILAKTMEHVIKTELPILFAAFVHRISLVSSVIYHSMERISVQQIH
jgi:hypothetical protein